jgi:hypothetical protein
MTPHPSYTFQKIFSILTHDAVYSNGKVHFMLSNGCKTYILSTITVLNN